VSVLRVLSITCLIAACAAAQVPKEERKQESEEAPSFEAEFVASDIFRSGTAIARLWRGLQFEGEYFGAANYDVGITGVGWRFRWRHFWVAPGIAAAFGSPADSAPVFTFRWNLETRRWFSQGFFGQSLTSHFQASEGEETRKVYASILDNNHISVRLGPVELGGLWERIRYREENEWKGGLRVAVRPHKNLKLIFQTVAPDVEFRGGIAFEK
jgi:hypothetical protein